jgi:ketosteroid isomerase-like protein
MTDTLTRQFIDALGRLERQRELGPIVALFADDARVGNVLVTEDETGPEGARHFWSQYRSSFGDVGSEFRNVIDADGRAALEWTTTGSSPTRDPLRYDGVSVMEHRDGRIVRFHAYFDPAALGRQLHAPATDRTR